MILQAYTSDALCGQDPSQHQRTHVKKRLNRIGGNMQPCFMPLEMSNGSENSLLEITTPVMLSWKEVDEV